MDQLTIEELPYPDDSALLFARFLDLKLPVLLDSAAPFSSRGRYDIFSAEPVMTVTQSNLNEISSSINSMPYDDDLTYFRRLELTLQEQLTPISNDYHLPFTGGAIGYFGYDLGRQLERVPSLASQDLTVPDACVGIYSWAVVVDHRQQRALLVAHPQASRALLHEVRQRLKQKLAAVQTEPFELTSSFCSNLCRNDYSARFNQIKQYIAAGDCYQANLAQRYSADYQGSPWQAYKKIRATAAAPFSAFMQLDNHSILSASPERFIHVANQRVSSSPIKGTIARGLSPAEDEDRARQLLGSAKDRAENLMIVDLLRNDLGKSCVPGSIQVDELFELQSFETVHHLVSTISGQLLDKKSPLQVLQDCFPGGSITGAPKVRAMEIIEELEPHRRTVYCGAMGYISCDGQMDTNIAIRTMVCEPNKIHCWAGGGIVADSDCENEYLEGLTKVEKLLRVMATGQ